MPTYEYRCSHCSYEFEEIQSIKAVPLVLCPQCKQERLYRIIGAGGGMIFKGSGFYQTDYKGGNSAPKESSTEKKPDAAPKETATENKKSDTAGKPAE